MKILTFLRVFMISMYNMALDKLDFFLLKNYTLQVIPLIDNSRQVSAPVNSDMGMGASTAAAAAAAAANMAANNPIVSIPGEIEMFPIPNAMYITHTSSNAGTAKTTYFLNTTSLYNTQPTDNDGGANTIVNTYGDGWSGLGYQNIVRSANNGRGVRCYGFTMHYITTSTGAENSAGITTANPTLQYYVNQGTGSIPRPISLNVGARNTQYLSGEMTVKANFWLNCVAQISYVLPINNTLSFTVLTQPLQ